MAARGIVRTVAGAAGALGAAASPRGAARDGASGGAGGRGRACAPAPCRRFDAMPIVLALALVRATASANLAAMARGIWNIGLVRRDADRADLVLGDMAAAADQRQDPARIGILAAADIHAEPDDVLEAGAVALLLARRGGCGVLLDQLLGLRHRGAVRADQRGGDILGRASRPAGAAASVAILVVDLDRLEQRGEQPLAIVGADRPRRVGAVDPFGVDPRALAASISTRRRRG